jgi:hypothetical protein
MFQLQHQNNNKVQKANLADEVLGIKGNEYVTKVGQAYMQSLMAQWNK